MDLVWSLNHLHYGDCSVYLSFDPPSVPDPDKKWIKLSKRSMPDGWLHLVLQCSLLALSSYDRLLIPPPLFCGSMPSFALAVRAPAENFPNCRLQTNKAVTVELPTTLPPCELCVLR